MAASQPPVAGPPLEQARWLTDIVAIVVPVAVAALGVWLLVAHWRVWQKVRATAAEARELEFQRRRYRRRMQTSGILALLGLAMLGGQAIAADKHPSLFVYFWCAVALLAVWAMALALADVISTRLYFKGLLRQQIVERAKLQAQLARIEKEQAGPPPE